MYAGNKTVRFAKIVERSGQPHVHTLWLPPEKDPELQRAQKAGRVMTVERSASGSKTDVGVVGFDPHAKNAQYLIFPKSLKAFDAARVIGIKFDLVDQPKLAPAHVSKSTIASVRKNHARPSVAKPPEIPHAGEQAAEAIRAETNHLRPSELAPEPPKETTTSRATTPHGRKAAAPPRSRSSPAVSPPASRSTRSSRSSAPPKKAASSDAALIREIRAALKELEAGKSVAAYQRLQRAIADRA
jgi:hypothetical protein